MQNNTENAEKSKNNAQNIAKKIEKIELKGRVMYSVMPPLI